MKELTVTIEQLVAGGNGFVRTTTDKPTFIPGAIPLDKVKIQITKEKKKYQEGEIVEIIEESPHRLRPPCKYNDQCGGCNLQHADKLCRENYMTEILKHNLTKIAKIDPEFVNLQKPYMMDDGFNYRVKCNFKFAHGDFGFYEIKSHSVVDIDECLIVSTKMNELFKKLKDHLKSFESENIPKFNVDISTPDDYSLAVFHLWARDDKFINYLKKIKFFNYVEIKVDRRRVFNTKDSFHFTYDGQKARPGSFIQVNPDINKQIKKIISEQMDTSKEILDIYCGHGNFSLEFAKKGVKVTGIEINKYSTHYLKRENNFSVIPTKAEHGLRILSEKKGMFSSVIIDPPRDGAVKILDDVMHLEANKIFYVSCDTATLARDLKELTPRYKITYMRPFEMFPQTSHIETLTILEKK